MLDQEKFNSSCQILPVVHAHYKYVMMTQQVQLLIWKLPCLDTFNLHLEIFFSGRLHQVPKQPIYILQFYPHYLSQLFILTHPVKFFPVRENRRTRRKPTTFGRVLTNSSHVHYLLDTGLEPVTSVVGGHRLEYWATEAPINSTFIDWLIICHDNHTIFYINR